MLWCTECYHVRLAHMHVSRSTADSGEGNTTSDLDFTLLGPELRAMEKHMDEPALRQHRMMITNSPLDSRTDKGDRKCCIPLINEHHSSQYPFHHFGLRKKTTRIDVSAQPTASRRSITGLRQVMTRLWITAELPVSPSCGRSSW